MNIIEIGNLPEADEVLSSDNLYAFCYRNGSYKMQKISISDLSAFFMTFELASQLNAKYEKLNQLKEEFISFLNENYPTAAYIDENYASEKYFLDRFNLIESIQKFDHDIMIQEYVPNHLADYTKKEQLARFEETKFNQQQEIRNTVLGPIDWADQSFDKDE